MENEINGIFCWRVVTVNFESVVFAETLHDIQEKIKNEDNHW